MAKRPPDTTRLSYLMASTGVSVTGDGILLAAAPLLAVSLTDVPWQVATVSVAAHLAWVVVGLPAGALVDRLSRRSIMMRADAVRAVAIAALAVLILVKLVTLPWLLLGIFVTGAGSCFFDPAAHATVPALVSKNKPALDRANGRLGFLDILGRSLAGPPLGAVLFNAGHALPFAVDAISFVASAAIIQRLPRDIPEKAGHPPLLHSIVEGMRFVWSTSQLRALTSGLALYNIGWNTAMATFVLFARHDLAVSGGGFGLMLSCMAVGGMASSLLTPRLLRRNDLGGLYSAMLLIQAISWGLAFFATSAWQVALLLVAVGGASSAVTLVVSSTRQHVSPAELTGRVVAAGRLVSVGSAVLGSLIGGATAQGLGLRAPFVVAAAVLALGGIGVWMPLHSGHLRSRPDM
jgi:MFS family permease